MNRWPCIIEYIGYEPINMCRSTADTLSQETMGWDALVTGHWSLVTGHWSLVTQVVIKADISLSKPEISWNRATNRRSTLARMGLLAEARTLASDLKRGNYRNVLPYRLYGVLIQPYVLRTSIQIDLSQRVRSTEYSYRIIQCKVSFVLSYVIGNELSDFENSKAGVG